MKNENENEIEIDILLDGETIDIAKFNKEMKINEVREYIKTLNLGKDFVFLKKDNPLNKVLENKLQLIKIVDVKEDSNFIYLKTLPENLSAPGVPLIHNTPINGATEILTDKNSSIKYYQYPLNIEFTSEEEDNSKVVLLVGKTGDGKSTFINALVNIYLGIQLEDNFRYLLINDQNKDQQESITKDISIYKIRPKEGLNFPFLKIIDTPGFGDTKGIEEDMKHIKNFQGLFENELIFINCICFIVKASDSRVDFHQEYILNCVMDLFAENIKDNFMVGVTNFIAATENEKPNIISNALSKENNFYYQNILKRDNLAREEILSSNWYFGSNNTTITNNKIKISQKSKLNWEEAVENINKFICKLKLLESRKIKESSNVIKNREELKIEIEGLTEKMERIMDNKKRVEENKKQQVNILLDIKQQEKIILELESKQNKDLYL